MEGTESRVIEDEDEYDSEGFLIRPRALHAGPSAVHVIAESRTIETEDEYDSEGFLIRPRALLAAGPSEVGGLVAGGESRAIESEDEYDSEGFLIRPHAIGACLEGEMGGHADGAEGAVRDDAGLRTLEDDDEYDSEGFRIRPRKVPATDTTVSGQARPAGRSTNTVLKAWSWKREHLSDEDRFHRPYYHSLVIPPASKCTIPIGQLPFTAEGFASTVWDSSIVFAKYVEHTWSSFSGCSCLELGAGCGLAGIAMHLMGGKVTLTDLPDNLPLLRANVAEALRNVDGLPEPPPAVEPLTWGQPLPCPHPFDVVVGCDVMYIREAVPALVQSLLLLSSPHTRIYLAYGRNRWAEEEFMREIDGKFRYEEVPEADQHPDFYTMDVTVLLLTKLLP